MNSRRVKKVVLITAHACAFFGLNALGVVFAGELDVDGHVAGLLRARSDSARCTRMIMSL